MGLDNWPKQKVVLFNFKVKNNFKPPPPNKKDSFPKYVFVYYINNTT